MLRAWNIANGPTARFHDRMDEIKATIQDEIRRGTALTQAEVATAYAQLAALWRETAAFFDRGYDVLACPVTQVSPFPVETEYPTVVDGVQMSNYIDWMATCWRITVTGCPTLSLLPASTPTASPSGCNSSPARAPTSNCCASPKRSRRQPASPPAAPRSDRRLRRADAPETADDGDADPP